MKPNIFLIPSVALSQETFFTWLLQWADEECAQYNTALHAVAQDFVQLLLGKKCPIQKVYVENQFEGIDIWAEINEQYFIAIQVYPKTSLDHNRVGKPKKIVRVHCKENQAIKPKYIYLKLENESHTKSNNENKVTIFNRKEILKYLTKSNTTSNILRQFVDYWAKIENETNSFTELQKLKSNQFAAQGFFGELQNRIQEFSDWEYVFYLNEGVWEFCYHLQELPKLGEIYIQIDNNLKGRLELLIKIEAVSQINPLAPILHQVFNEIEPFAAKHGLTIHKPKRHEFSGSSGVAAVNNAFPQVDFADFFDLEHFLMILKKLEATIDKYCQSKKTIQRQSKGASHD